MLAKLLNRPINTPDEYDALVVEVFVNTDAGRKLLAKWDGMYNNINLFDKDSERATVFSLGRRDVILDIFKSIARSQTKGVK